VPQLVSQAEERLAAGDPIGAKASFTKALQADPSNTLVRLQLGRLLYALGQPTLARSHLEAALESGISPASVLPPLAKALAATDDFDELLAFEAPPGTPRDASAALQAQQAYALLLLDREAEAEARLAQARHGAGGTEPVVVVEALFLVREGKREAAENHLRAFLDESPNAVDALGLLGDLSRDSGRLEDAEALYTRAIEAGGFRLDLHFLRGEVRLELAMVDAAAEDVAAVQDAVADTFSDHYLQGRLLLLRGDSAEALARLEAAAKLKPSHPGTLLHGGVAAYATGRRNLAEDWLARVIKEFPQNAQARLVLGALRFEQGRFSEAVHYLRPLPAAMTEYSAGHRLLAAALIANGDAAAAIPLLEGIAASRPEDPRSQLDVSVALLLSGSDTTGTTRLSDLLASHPDYRPAYEYLIAFYVREQRWEDALTWAARFVAQYPGDAQALFFQGEALAVAGRTNAARAAYREALEMESAHPGANMRLASLALARSEPEAAELHYDRILSEHPQHVDALLAKAQLASSEQRFGDAGALLGQAVTASPRAMQPRMLLARLELARGQAQQAVTALEEGAPEVLRQDPEYMRLLSQSLLAAETPRLAAEAARELVALEPDSLDAYGLYADILKVLGDKVALEETLKQMLTIDPGHVPTRLELVRLHIATERFGVGERLLDPLLQDLDRPPLADLLFGLILTATDRATQAIVPLKHAYSAKPSVRTLLALANAEGQAGHVADAIARTAEWLDDHPDDVEVRVTRAGHLVQAERVMEAIAEYERVVAAHPNHAVALNNLAWYALAQDPQRAIGYAQRALEAKPDSVEVAHTLVSAQVEAGEWRDAELTLDRMLPLHPTDPGLLWLSARVLHNKGRAETALRRLERLLNDDLPDQERDRARGLLVQIQDELRAQEAEKLW
jgi:putative PEP-CTERM system TPR-repeat lipoprotein